MKHYFKTYGSLCAAGVLLLVCIYLTAMLYTNRGIVIVSVAVAALLMIGILPALFLHNWDKKTLSHQYSEDDERLKNLVCQRMENEDPETQGILQLSLMNTRQLRNFYIESRQQAKKAFALAVTMCIIGGLLLCLSISAIIFLNLNTTTITVGAVGGVIVEFIAGTSFFIYQKALRQYNHYYRSLHENERLLLILHLTSKLNEDTPKLQGKMYTEIIRSQLSYINREFWLDAENPSQPSTPPATEPPAASPIEQQKITDSTPNT